MAGGGDERKNVYKKLNANIARAIDHVRAVRVPMLHLFYFINNIVILLLLLFVIISREMTTRVLYNNMWLVNHDLQDIDDFWTVGRTERKRFVQRNLNKYTISNGFFVPVWFDSWFRFVFNSIVSIHLEF